MYPQGVTHAQTSQRVKGLAVLLYLLGLSYGAVSLALEALGVYMAKNRVYQAVQAAPPAPGPSPQPRAGIQPAARLTWPLPRPPLPPASIGANYLVPNLMTTYPQNPP